MSASNSAGKRAKGGPLPAAAVNRLTFVDTFPINAGHKNGISLQTRHLKKSYPGYIGGYKKGVLRILKKRHHEKNPLPAAAIIPDNARKDGSGTFFARGPDMGRRSQPQQITGQYLRGIVVFGRGSQPATAAEPVKSCIMLTFVECITYMQQGAGGGVKSLRGGPLGTVAKPHTKNREIKKAI